MRGGGKVSFQIVLRAGKHALSDVRRPTRRWPASPVASRVRQHLCLAGLATGVALALVVPTVARARPGSGRVVMRVPTLAEWGEGPVRLLVLRSLLHDGRRWLAVRLPERPNASLGWIRADLARVATTPGG